MFIIFHLCLDKAPKCDFLQCCNNHIAGVYHVELRSDKSPSFYCTLFPLVAGLKCFGSDQGRIRFLTEIDLFHTDQYKL